MGAARRGRQRLAARAVVLSLATLASLPAATASEDTDGAVARSRFRFGEGSDAAAAAPFAEQHGRRLKDNDKSRKKEEKEREKREKEKNKSKYVVTSEVRSPGKAPNRKPNRAPWSDSMNFPSTPSQQGAPTAPVPTAAAGSGWTLTASTPGPTQQPTNKPTPSPSTSPTEEPTASPTQSPSSSPTRSPSASPTQAPTTSSPTEAPTPLPYCPPAYDPLKTDYIGGEPVEVESHIFMCNDSKDANGTHVHEPYCSIPDEDPAWSEAEYDLWDNAWPYVSACYRTVSPTESPTTGEPTTMPSGEPSSGPSEAPSAEPSVDPTFSPSDSPSLAPTFQPTTSPTRSPSQSPSHSPTSGPTISPSEHPTDAPTANPTLSEFWYPNVYSKEDECSHGFDFPHWMAWSKNADTFLFATEEDCCAMHGCQAVGAEATLDPTPSPTMHPTTKKPTMQPSSKPTVAPSSTPTVAPSKPPVTADPTSTPTRAPSTSPTRKPVIDMTNPPTQSPSTGKPTTSPSVSPTASPSKQPTVAPVTLEPQVVPACPDTYDSATVYRAGSQMAVNGMIYECRAYPWAFYCQQPNFKPQPDNPNSSWRDAWTEVGSCETQPTVPPTPPPTNKPTVQPTGKPTPLPTTKYPTQQPTPDPLNTLYPYPYPFTRFTQWDELSSGDKAVASGSLGYDKSSWNNLEISVLESYLFSDLTEAEQRAVELLGMGQGMWDCFMNHYNGYYWSDLQAAGVAQHYAALGWTMDTWDNDGPAPATDDMGWDDLNSIQQQAATKVCFSKNAWEWVNLKWW